jgi:hypothetical protein
MVQVEKLLPSLTESETVLLDSGQCAASLHGHALSGDQPAVDRSSLRIFEDSEESRQQEASMEIGKEAAGECSGRLQHGELP